MSPVSECASCHASDGRPHTDYCRRPCYATVAVQLGNQRPQKARCIRTGDHSPHADVILDSDDNAITYTWR